MTDKNDKPAGGFLSRWSRRKAEQEASDPRQAELEPVAEALPKQVADASRPTPGMPPNSSTSAPLQAGVVENRTDSGVSATPSLPLPPVESLTAQSDFTPFMAKDVPAGLRNQAMKKLFTDPRYALIDQMDIYIADYTQPDPIPVEMLRMMHQSKMLKLFDEEEEQEQKESVAASASPDTPERVQAQPSGAPAAAGEGSGGGDATVSASNEHSPVDTTEMSAENLMTQVKVPQVSKS